MDGKKGYVKLWVSYKAYFETYSAAEVGHLVLAMIGYKSSGAEPEFSGSERYIWPAIKRDIDEATAAQELTSEKNAENGKKGGRPRKAKGATAFSESERGHGQRTEGKEQGQELGQEAAREEDAVAMVLADYKDRVNPRPSRHCLDELAVYAGTLGEAVCKRAFDKAVDNQNLRWDYIQGILRSWSAKGVTCLEDLETKDRKTDRHPCGEDPFLALVRELEEGGEL